MGEAALGLVKQCCLNSGCSTLQVPWLNKATGFVVQTFGSIYPFLGSSSSGLHSCYVFLLAHLVRYRNIFSSMDALCSSLVGKRQATPGKSQFPKQDIWLERSGATLMLVCELIPLPLCSMGRLHTWYWLCSGELSALPGQISAQFLLSCTATSSCHQVFWSDEVGSHSLQWAGLSLSTLPGCGQTRL